MKITNTQPGPRGINTANGTVLVDPGQTIEAKVYAREREHIEAAGWFTTEGSYTANPEVAPASGVSAGGEDIAALKARIAELEGIVADRDDEIAKLKKPASTGPEAKHRGAGSYSIMEGDTEVREKLTKDQAEAFNALDADGKAKWLADNPKAA